MPDHFTPSYAHRLGDQVNLYQLVCLTSERRKPIDEHGEYSGF